MSRFMTRKLEGKDDGVLRIIESVRYRTVCLEGLRGSDGAIDGSWILGMCVRMGLSMRLKVTDTRHEVTSDSGCIACSQKN